MYLEIVTPEKTLFSGEIEKVKLPGSSGSFGLLNRHAPMISSLEAGEIKLTPKEGDVTLFDIKSGVVEVLNNNIIVLATE